MRLSLTILAAALLPLAAQAQAPAGPAEIPVTRELQLPDQGLQAAMEEANVGGFHSALGGYFDLQSGTSFILHPALSLHTSIVDSNLDGFHETVLKIDLAPFHGYTRASFVLIHEGQPTGFSLNIGDSATNNGGGGDAGTQSRDAELQIKDGVFSVFPSDPYAISSFCNMAVDLEDSAVRVGVADMHVNWQHAASALDFQNGPDILFALSGQADLEGPVNYEIYAGFNRVISGPGSRIGAGLSRVLVLLE